MALLGFPNPVNEVAARAVAAQVLLLTGITIVLGTAVDTAWLWLSTVLAAGFLARVASGPRFSPFGLLATRVIAPAIGHEKLVPGPPKRFAQAMGLTMTGAAAVLQALGEHTAVVVLLAMVVVAAGLESVVGYCLGCTVFGFGMRLGLVPEEVCAECADISLRQRRSTLPV